MNTHPARHYRSAQRQKQAETTRQSILQAARDLFTLQGYQATTLQAIAEKADVAVPTIYATFGSKAAILSALVKSVGSDEDIRALSRRAFAEPDPWRQGPLVAKVFRAIHEREAEILDLLWQAGGGDPDLADVWRQSHQQQLARQSEILNGLAAKGALRHDLPLEMAIDTHWVISSPEVFRLLVRERGWTPDQYERWLAESLARLLLSEPAPDSER